MNYPHLPIVLRPIFLSFLFFLIFGSVYGQYIGAVAGTGSFGYSGDGGAATAADLFYPQGIAFDGTGTLFFCDYSNGRIRVINHAGIVTTFVGGAAGLGFSGDGGPAVLARITHPAGLAFDTSGNLYFADANNFRIRKVATSGIITTIAGTGGGGVSGDGGPATAATFGQPSHIAIDKRNGNIYFTDIENDRVRKITPAGIISTFAGSSTGYCGDGGPATAACLNQPVGIAIDSAGNVFICDKINDCVRKVDTSGIITTFAGIGYYGAGPTGDGGPATAAQIAQPFGIAIADNGDVYIGTRRTIRMVNTSGIISTIAGVWSGSIVSSGDGGPASAAEFSWTIDPVFDNLGNLYICDREGNTIRIICKVADAEFTVPTFVCATTSDTLRPQEVAGAFHTTTWASSAGAIATIDASGIVTGVSPGVAVITHTFTNRCGESDTVTHNITITGPPSAGTITGATTFCERATTILSDTTGSGVWSSGTSSMATVSASGIVTGLVAGVALISYTVTSICGTTSTSVPVTINPLPIAGTISGASTICIGVPATFSDGATDGVWSVSNSHATISAAGLLTGVSVGFDTVLYTVTNSCGTAIARLGVSVADLPVIDIIAGLPVVCPGGTTTLTNTTAGGTWAASNSSATVIGGVVTGVMPGTDTISYTVTNVCGSSTASKIVVINPLLVPSVANTVSLDSVICSGESVVFTAHPVNGGSSPYIGWFRSGLPVGTGTTYTYAPTNGDAISCTIVSNAACTRHDTVSSNTIAMAVTPMVVPFTIITASPNDTVAFVGQTIIFTAGLTHCSAAQYQWFVNSAPISGATTSTYSFSTINSDSVYCMVTCNTGCASTFYNRSNVIVICPVPPVVNGVGNLQLAVSSLQLFPNPNNGDFTIMLSNSQQQEARVIITDLLGKKIKEFDLAANRDTAINLAVAAGIYLVSATTKSETVTKMVIVE